VPLGEFITGVRRTARRPSELVTAVIVPDLAATARSAFLKLGSRAYLVISIAMVAVVIVPDDAGRIVEARVAVGACSPVAKRLPALEQALQGLPFAGDAASEAVRAEHLAPLSPIDDIRGSAGYRLQAVQVLLRRALAAPAAELAA
jgi:CO/xanthine dehydrogenase FAD-binding subunit